MTAVRLPTSNRQSETATTTAGPLVSAADLGTVVAGIALVAGAAVAGRHLIAAGVNIFLGFPPLLANWAPHVGPGSVPAVLVAAAVIVAGPTLAQRLSWRGLLVAAWVTCVCWTTSLALVDGYGTGIEGRLTTDQEYLFNVPGVGSIAGMLRTFTDHMLTNQPQHWTTHVGGHPPGVFLLFLLLDRVGLGGGGPAGFLCILVGASAAPAIAIALRALGTEDAARAMLPFAVLTPAAVWIGVSADGMFAGVLAWAVALLAVASTRSGRGADAAALGAGVLGGYALYLSYGLVLGWLCLAAVPVLTRRLRPALLALVGAGVVALGFTAAGFWWFTGYRLVRVLYFASIARSRPYEYFWWADLAALTFILGPAVLVGLRRLASSQFGGLRSAAGRVAGRRAAGRPLTVDRSSPVGYPAVTALVAAAATAILVADLSGLSKGEVERIWLPFAVWLAPVCALLPGERRRVWLAAQAVLALGVNHLLRTVW